MSKFKILYLHPTGRFSGAENSLLNLVRKLSKTEFSPSFICPEGGIFVEELRKSGVDVDLVKLPKIRKGIGVFKAVRRISEIIKRRNIHLLHSNNIRTNIYATMTGRRAKIPVIWHQRNLIANEIIDLDRLFSFLPDKIICNSQAVARRFMKDGKLPEKVCVIYNGVDTQRFNPGVSGETVRREFRLRAEATVVGIVSRFGPDKGHEDFLQAANLIVNSELGFEKDVRFLIVGDSVFQEDKWREEYLGKMSARLGLNDFVVFTGFCRDMPKAIAALDIVVLPSQAEACGRVLIEAMASGKPVVATNTGGTPEIVADGRTGILIPPHNSDALAGAVIELLKDKEKAMEMGLAGRRRAEDTFSIEKNVKKTEDIYLNLLERQDYG